MKNTNVHMGMDAMLDMPAADFGQAATNDARLKDLDSKKGKKTSTKIPHAYTGGSLQLRGVQSDCDETKTISRVLPGIRPDLGEDPGDQAGAAYLSSSFVAYASEQGRNPETAKQWRDVLLEVL